MLPNTGNQEDRLGVSDISTMISGANPEQIPFRRVIIYLRFYMEKLARKIPAPGVFFSPIWS